MERVIEVRRTPLPEIYRRPVINKRQEIPSKEIGRRGLAVAISYFGNNGYTVCIPMNDTQWYDLIVEKDGKMYTVQVKATAMKDGRICMKTKGGSEYDRHICDHCLWHDELDYIFGVDRFANCYLIPVKDIREYGLVSKISLKPNRGARGPAGFDASRYIVEMIPWKAE